jgi:hypothetical protein
MDNHTAILKAQEMLKFPIKDAQLAEWVVEYRSGKHWVKQTFVSDEAAYVFYYTKLGEFKAQIMTQRGKAK